MESKGKSVAVIGAGFTGLTSAYFLARAGYSVEIFEARSKTGGLISTLKTPHGLVETAANAFLNSVLVEDLFADLGVPLLPTKKSARKRYIVRDGEARMWPLGWRGSLRFVWFVLRFIFTRRRLAPHSEETARAWAERVFGVEGARYLVEAALQGIYAGDPGRMSASVLFEPLFVKKQLARKPRVRGSVSAPEGMGQVISALEAKLRQMGCVFRLESEFKFDTAPSRPVVVATSARDAARVLHEISPARARALESVEIVPVTTATLFFDRTDPSTKGFGCLFPPIEGRKALGVLKNDFIFDNRVRGDVHGETWILGGARAPDGFSSWNDDEVIDTIVAERAKIFDLQDRPIHSVITRWTHAIPHYTLELERVLPTLTGVEQNVWLAGNYLGRIGLAKILERVSELPAEIEKKGKWQ